MTEHQNPGGFAGDPAAALTVAGSTGCCGNPARATNIALPDPAGTEGATCCGTRAAAAAANACCDPDAKADAVATGSGCCG